MQSDCHIEQFKNLDAEVNGYVYPTEMMFFF